MLEALLSSFYIYSAADLGLSDTFANWFANPASKVAINAAADILEMSDDDLILGNEGVGSDQLLTENLYIDGVLVGVAGDVVLNLGQSIITNATTGETGYLVVIQVNGVAVGYGSTIALNPDDNISMTAWAGTTDEIAYDTLDPNCFVLGTHILTQNGQVPIENLQIGDRVWTRDNGFQAIRWIGHQNCKGHGRFAPIKFQAGALGQNTELLVSPMHRMVITGWKPEVIYRQAQVLVHARDMVNGSTITLAPQHHVDYFHLMFDAHQIISAANALSESFHPFNVELASFDQKTRDELRAIFPSLACMGPKWHDVRPTLSASETMLLQSL